MHENYSWDGNDNLGLELLSQQLTTILGNEAILSRIIELNDSDRKSFSEIADWLETIYLAEWT